MIELCNTRHPNEVEQQLGAETTLAVTLVVVEPVAKRTTGYPRRALEPLALPNMVMPWLTTNPKGHRKPVLPNSGPDETTS